MAGSSTPGARCGALALAGPIPFFLPFLREAEFRLQALSPWAQGARAVVALMAPRERAEGLPTREVRVARWGSRPILSCCA